MVENKAKKKVVAVFFSLALSLFCCGLQECACAHGREIFAMEKKSSGICCVRMLITWSRMGLVHVNAAESMIVYAFGLEYKNKMVILCCWFFVFVVVVFSCFFFCSSACYVVKVSLFRSPFKSVADWLLVRQFLCTVPGIQDLYLRNSDARRCCFSFCT